MTTRVAEADTRFGRETGTSFWSRAWQNHAPGYLFLLPWFIGFFGLTIGPILTSFYLSFTDFDLLTPAQWIGTANYERMFTADRNFAASMRVTLFFVLFSVPLKLAFALCIAMLLNRGMRGLPLYRALFYLPSLLGASVAIAVLWRQLFAKDGLANVALGFFGVEGPSWISDPNYSLYTLVLLSVWQFGSPMIIFLAGLRQIPPDVYEAANIDGANKVQQFFRITLPLITPAILSGWLLAFTLSWDDVVVSQFVAGPGANTLPMVVYSKVRLGVNPSINALATLMVLLVATGVVVSAIFMKRAERRREREMLVEGQQRLVPDVLLKVSAEPEREHRADFRDALPNLPARQRRAPAAGIVGYGQREPLIVGRAPDRGLPQTRMSDDADTVGIDTAQ